jgi:hypothetical protein
MAEECGSGSSAQANESALDVTNVVEGIVQCVLEQTANVDP